MMSIVGKRKLFRIFINKKRKDKNFNYMSVKKLIQFEYLEKVAVYFKILIILELKLKASSFVTQDPQYLKNMVLKLDGESV